MATYAQEDLVVFEAGTWTRDGDPTNDPAGELAEVLTRRDIAATELRVLLEDPEDGGVGRYIVEFHPVDPGA